MKQVPVEEWIYGPRPGSIREVWDHTDQECVHGVPLRVFDCPYCWQGWDKRKARRRTRAERRARLRQWLRTLCG